MNHVGLILVGLPGSGKTYFRHQLEAYHNDHSNSRCTTISSDDVLERFARERGITYNDAWAQVADEAAKESDAELASALALSDQLIIIDRTILTSRSRAKYIKQFKQNKYVVACLMFGIPPAEEHDKRLNRPGKAINDVVLAEMMKRYEIPSLSEGFQLIEYIDTTRPYAVASYYKKLECLTTS